MKKVEFNKKIIWTAVLCALVAVGCTTAPEVGNVDAETARTAVEAENIQSHPTSAEMAYGVWIGKGPKILSSDGNPLKDAKVVFSSNPQLDGFRIEDDGRVIINRYVAGEYRGRFSSCELNVSCPGYHPVVGVELFGPDGLIKEIRLKPVLGQPPCREFTSTALIRCAQEGDRCSFDLVEGDWLPPYGWGKVEDIRVTISTNNSESQMFSVSAVSGVKPYDRNSGTRQLARFEFVGEGDGMGKDADDYQDCTNRIFYYRRYDDFRGVFKARGFYGSIDSACADKEHFSYSVEEEKDGKRTYVTKKSPEICRVIIKGRVNTKPGLKALEPSTASAEPRPPVSHPVPKGFDKMAFGVSRDGRAAVCFGWTKDGAVVPGIFEKGIYTSDPARDLPDVETLYSDPSFCRGDKSPMVNGLRNLRTLVCLGSGFSGNLGEKSFAGNPKLDAVIFGGLSYDSSVAGDAFDGASDKLTAVFADRSYNAFRPWETTVVSNIFTRMIKVYAVSDSSYNFAVPEIDVSRGEVELPLIRLCDEYIDKEYSDGRILRYRKDGRTEKLRESR